MTYRVEVVSSIDEDAFLAIYNANKDEIVANSGYEEYERLLLQFKNDGVFIVAGIDNDTNEHVGYASGVVSKINWHLTNIVAKSPAVFMALSGDLMHSIMLENKIAAVHTWCKKDSSMFDTVQASFNRPDLYLADPPVKRDEDFYNIKLHLIVK